MARRFAIILVPVLLALWAALGVPLAVSTAGRETQAVHLDRLADAGRFADLAGEALATGVVGPLDAELERYREVYGATALVVGPGASRAVATTGGVTGGDVVAGPDLTGLDATSAARLADDLAVALGGDRPASSDATWPWSTRPLLVVEPVSGEGQRAAVVIVSPSDELVGRLRRTWALWGLGGALTAALALLVVPALTRWPARPLHRLDEAAAAVADGDLTTRVDAASGPPEVQRLAASFNRMVDVVETTNHRQRAFVADASHQLRNPLAALRLSVDNLSPHLGSDEARETHADAVADAEAMGRLLEALLAATRLEELDAAATAELGGDQGLLASRAAGWRARAAAASVRVDVEVPAAPLPVRASPETLGGVLDELVANALRLSGCTTVAVLTERAPDGGAVVLRVVDDGAGLAPAERTRALQRFWRSPRHQNTEGTGLGLAIAAEVAASAGGRLELADAPGGGLDVRLVLPLVTPAP